MKSTQTDKKKLSEYQKQIIIDANKGIGHTIIEARAGCGKTFVILESLKYIPRGKKTLLLAFNKIIAKELQQKAPSHVYTFTFHALGYAAIKKRFGEVEIDEYKMTGIIQSILGKDVNYDLLNSLCDTIAYCKYSLTDTPSKIEEIIVNFSVDTFDMEMDDFIKIVIKALALSKAKTSKIDFNDMCLFPYIYNLPLGQYDMVYVDECFPANQYIATDSGKEKIRVLYNKFVSGKELPLIKSYNEELNKFEYNKIINAWCRGKKNLFEIKCGKRYIKCTANHKFLTTDGWVECSNLKKGQLIKTSEPNCGQLQLSLNDDQYQILLGSFLGDGNVNDISHGRYRLTINHGIKQQKYCEWKAEQFKCNTSVIEKNGFAQNKAICFKTKTFSINNFFPKNKSTCPQWVLDDLDARGLAIWFMDDGSKQHNSAKLWTSSFDDDSQERIVKKLNDLNIFCKHLKYNKKKNQKKYSYIAINAIGYKNLCALIAPYVHENLFYKFNHHPLNNYKWNNEYNIFGYAMVDDIKDLKKEENVYDLEIENNHNFIVCSGTFFKKSKSDSGLIAHNCQDLNRSQLFMAKKACKKDGGRIIAAGDSFQAIYSWRLADSSFIEDLKKQDNTKILSLPISYRCPKKVIDICKNWVPNITCPDTAIDGNIFQIHLNDLYEKAKPGCFILSRTNAPLIKICMTFIRQGIKANIKGKDIGNQLNFIIKKSKKKTISGFLSWLSKWKDEEIEKLLAKKFNTENLLDRYECLVSLCDESKTLEEVSLTIKNLFNDADENNIITLSTVHKSKGLERENVFILKWSFRVHIEDENVSLLEKPNEEGNISYVAFSRSLKNVYVVNKY